MAYGSIPQMVYEELFQAYGPQAWWPAETRLEVAVGAILVQNTSWKNVEKAIANLKDEGVLTLSALHVLPDAELEILIQPAGYFRVKTKRLRSWVNFMMERFEGSLERLFALGLPEARNALLSVSGIGPETADAMLLYAGDLPTFVVDAYAHRIFRRHGWIAEDSDYHQTQEYFMDQLPSDARLFNEYHALLVQVGKTHCKKQPQCDCCPLNDMLPPGGPMEME